MKSKAILCLFSLLLSAPALAEQTVEIAFESFNASLIKYGEKVGVCSALAKRNRIANDELLLLRKVPVETLKDALGYLSEIARNECTQPERGHLAESILHVESLALKMNNGRNKHILSAMHAIKNIEFNILTNSTAVDFYNIDNKHKIYLSKITFLKTPFDMVGIFKLTYPDFFN